jgi:hypothetical protein
MVDRKKHLSPAHYFQHMQALRSGYIGVVAVVALVSAGLAFLPAQYRETYIAPLFSSLG